MNKKGFTLVEMIVAVMIFSIFILAVGAIMTSSWKFWNSGWEQVRLQRDASYTFARVEKIIRNGSTPTVLGGGSGLQVVKDGTPSWTKTFQKVGNVLRLVEGENSEDIISGVQSISFSTSTDTVTIRLILQDGNSRTDFRTTVLLRNQS